KFKIMGGEKPECKVIDRDEYQDINEFGDGLKHYISIICSLYACENGYLFIDEIDNGIHYTQLDRLWEIILRISKEQKVQVFATTHSKECIESYARVSKKLEDEDISFIELGRNKENKLDSIVMNSERFLRYIEIGNEVRGW
ncbi:MAG: AAA family ATPase, partial [Campylobacterota bacterium]|nr:AAA family ATPase [Campylobacterota bacterium]